MGAGGGEALGGLAAGAAVGAGDDDGAPGLVGDDVHRGLLGDTDGTTNWLVGTLTGARGADGFE